MSVILNTQLVEANVAKAPENVALRCERTARAEDDFCVVKHLGFHPFNEL